MGDDAAGAATAAGSAWRAATGACREENAPASSAQIAAADQ
jgi:hypothetical protein